MDQDIWVKSHWTLESLANQSVEFRLPQVARGLNFGLGRFITKSANDELSVMIEVGPSDGTAAQCLPLSQAEVDSIKPAPARLGVAFTCYAQP